MTWVRLSDELQPRLNGSQTQRRADRLMVVAFGAALLGALLGLVSL